MLEFDPGSRVPNSNGIAARVAVYLNTNLAALPYDTDRVYHISEVALARGEESKIVHEIIYATDCESDGDHDRQAQSRSAHDAALNLQRWSFVEKRTAAANQLRAAFAEFGIIAPVGACGFKELLQLIESKAESFARLPQALRLVLCELAWQWQSCEAAVRRMDVEIAAGVKTSERAKRLTGVPTIGPVGASAIDALLPDPQLFRSGRDFAAWVGLTPREDSTGKTIKRGPITKKGDGYLRRLLVLGATSYLARVRRGPGMTGGLGTYAVDIASSSSLRKAGSRDS